jgi:hypothetical protein
MANPSITNATAVGKEVIRRSYVDALPESSTVVLQGVANHIFTILSMVICERSASADAGFYMYILPDGGTAIYLCVNQFIGPEGTYIWNDKIALTETDTLKMECAGAGTVTMDIWITYIDQQFAAP